MKKPSFVMFVTAMMALFFFVRDSFAAPAAPEEGKAAPNREFARSISECMREEKKESWAERKKALLEYGVSVTPKNEASLREFQSGEGAASRAIGQGKARMIFHLLRRLAGEEAFTRVAAKLEGEAPASSWDEVRALFEKETGQNLDGFFKQWVDRKGLPDLSVENVAVRRNGSRFEVSFDLFQDGEVYALDVPLSLSFLRGGGKEELVKMDSGKKHASFLVDDEPSEITIDRDYDLPRRLTDAETPPLLAKLLVEEKLLLVPPADGTGAYAGMIDAWKQRGAEERKAADVRDADIKASSLIVLGAGNPVAQRLYGKVEAGAEAVRLTAKKNPWNTDKVVVIVQAQTATAFDAVQAVVASGGCSSLSVDALGRMTQQTAESDRGMVAELRAEAPALEVTALKTLSGVIEKAAEKKIVYVGEYHDRFAHHNVELRVMKSLFKKDPGIAIGMEMFQRPSQKALDDYISGAIDEREFLKKSEYFKRWIFDYNLYKPILDFARAGKIPVIALNQKSELVDKVSKGGMDSLSVDEKKETPAQMDFSDSEYRERLSRVFEQHKNRGERNFDFFYQAQILWDETMAESIDAYLQKNPDRRMIVIAGSGHLIFGSGIPKRVFRRNGLSYATILNDTDVDGDAAADYLVFPQPLEGMMAPRILAMLEEKPGKVSVTDLPEGSVSRKAGIREGDILLSFDGAPVHDVADIKIALFYKKHGDSVRIKVRRRRFLLGDKEMEFDVKLP